MTHKRKTYTPLHEGEMQEIRISALSQSLVDFQLELNEFHNAEETITEIVVERCELSWRTEGAGLEIYTNLNAEEDYFFIPLTELTFANFYPDTVDVVSEGHFDEEHVTCVRDATQCYLDSLQILIHRITLLNEAANQRLKKGN